MAEPTATPVPQSPTPKSAVTFDYWYGIIALGILAISIVVGIVAMRGTNRDGHPTDTPHGHATGHHAGTSETGDFADLTVIHYNDFHATFEPRTTTLQDGTRVQRGGIAHLVGAVKHFRHRAAQSGERLIVVDAGDFYTGHALDTLTNQVATQEFHNLISPDAAALGNHEFDRGDLHHIKLIRGELGVAGVKFPLLSANVRTGDDAPWRPYTILNVKGLRVGVIGLNTPELFEVVSKQALAHTRLFDLDLALDSALGQIEAHTDIVVVLSHCGVDVDKQWIPRFADRVHLVVAGHSHTFLDKGISIAGVPVVSAGAYGQVLGEANVRIDVKNRRIVDWRAQLHPLYHGDLGVAPPDGETAQILENKLAEIRPILDRQVATVEAPMSNVPRPESVLGKWMAMAMLDAVPEADLAIMNAFGVRRAFDAGPLTAGVILETSPFQNMLVTVTFTGRDLLAGVENCIGQRPIQIAGATLEYCPLLGPGRVVVGMKVKGQPLDLDREYTVVLNDYVAGQQPKYFVKKQPATPQNTGLVDFEVFTAYAEKQKLISPERLGAPTYQLVAPPADAALFRGESGLTLGKFLIADVFAGDWLTAVGVSNLVTLAGIEAEGVFPSTRDNPEAAEFEALAKSDFAAYCARVRGNFAKPGRFGTPIGEVARSWLASKLRHATFVRFDVEAPGRYENSAGQWDVFLLVPTESGEWQNLNVELVRNGLAAVCPKRGRSRLDAELQAAQAEARAAQRGIWAEETPLKNHYPDYAERLAWWEKNAQALAAYDARRAADEAAVPLMLDAGRDAEKLRASVGQTVAVLGFVRNVDAEKRLVFLDYRADTPFAIEFADAAAFEKFWRAEFIGEYVRVEGTVVKTEVGWRLSPTAMSRYE